MSDLPEHRGEAFLRMLERAPDHALRESPWLSWHRLHLLAGTPGVTYAQLEEVAAQTLNSMDPQARGTRRLMQEAFVFGVRRVLGDYEGADEMLVPLLTSIERLQAPVAYHASRTPLRHPCSAHSNDGSRRPCASSGPAA
ncbi:hypothetical protein [Nesterenkonia pannonica]|uniref:hypothetical protein n=1 Tax=Nesterenkonia pannonica TaxID=1548602 RepID=UPI00216406BD|nr:hypothetical protein [Nesterenkonia pannonica]